jgi:hypothetical protein
MLNNISWASYLYAISIILLIYYAFVLIVYYRNDLQNRVAGFKRRFDQASAGVNAPTEKMEADLIAQNTERDLPGNTLHELSLSIQSLIKIGASRNFPREELLLSLQLQLRKYTGEKNTNFKDNVSKFIIAACEDYCSIHLSVEEVSALWID